MDGEKDGVFRKIHPELDLELIQEHPAKAEAIINSLPLQEQLELALERRGSERMELLLLSKKSESLVRALPEEELYFTIKEVGEEDSLPLLRLASHKQLTYVFDLEFWHEEQIVPERLFRWLDLLKQSDEERFREWLRKTDLELLILILQKAVKIYVTDPDDAGAEPWREKDLFTLDEQYYFEIIDERFQPIIERLLVQLRDLEQDKFYALMDNSRLQVTTENEDLAHRVRQGRLEDHGFYAFDEALKLYHAIAPEKLKELEKKPERPEPENAPGAHFALTLAQELPLFLARALSELSPEELEDFHHQFARLANKVMAADAMDLTQLDSLGAAVKKVYGYVEIGLESWSEGNFPKAVELLRRQWLEHIFQAGFSQVLARSKRAHRIKNAEWFMQLSEPFAIFGDPDGKMLLGLTLARPKFYIGEKGNENAEFKSLSEVRLVEKAVERAELWQYLVFKILGLDKAKLEKLMAIYAFELNFKIILATSLVNGALKAVPACEPLRTEDLSRFIKQAMNPAEPARKIYPNLKQEFMSWIEQHADEKLASRAAAKELVDAAIVSIEEELGMIKDIAKINPDLITCVIMARHKKQKPAPQKEDQTREQEPNS